MDRITSEHGIVDLMVTRSQHTETEVFMSSIPFHEVLVLRQRSQNPGLRSLLSALMYSVCRTYGTADQIAMD